MDPVRAFTMAPGITGLREGGWLLRVTAALLTHSGSPLRVMGQHPQDAAPRTQGCVSLTPVGQGVQLIEAQGSRATGGPQIAATC